MYVLKALWRYFKLSNGGHDMALYFCLLAGNTLTCPLANVLLDVWPNEFISDGLPRSLNSRMAKAMDNVKYPASIRKRNEWSGWSVGHIYKQVRRPNFYLSET